MVRPAEEWNEVFEKLEDPSEGLFVIKAIQYESNLSGQLKGMMDAAEIGRNVQPLTYMNNQDIIKAIAELDKLKIGQEMMGIDMPMPKYLTSRDAIVPVIEKQDFNTNSLISVKLFSMQIEFLYLATPFQLCKALLCATGKWIE